MRIWTFSDLHRDFDDWSPVYVPDAGVCVVAGDVGEGLVKSMRWLQKEFGVHMPVIFVAGNHEFYRTSMTDELAAARAVDDCPGVHFLEDDMAVIGGVRFLGCTLWTDYAAMEHRGSRESAMAMARSSMNDHRLIAWKKKPDWERFTPNHAYRKHAKSRAFLMAALAQPFDGQTVVVTHHAPHPLSIAAIYAKDLLTAAYVSDLSELIEASGPDLWIHGHMHTSNDYDVGATRVVSNPRGYGLENVYHFLPDFTLELGRRKEPKP